VFEDSLAVIISLAGKHLVLSFFDLEPGGYGPRRVTKREIKDRFRDAWVINYIRPEVFESRTRKGGSCAWFSLILKMMKESPAWLILHSGPCRWATPCYNMSGAPVRVLYIK
jgi:hypothetical protein